MSKIDFTLELEELRNSISTRITSDGASIATKLFDESEMILAWIGFLVQSEVTGKCDDFLDGLRASILETIACGSIGFIRPAIFALRAQIDIVHSWLYFKDHPVEWTTVLNTGEGFMLKRDVKEYLSKHIAGYDQKFSVLLKRISRREADPYKLLSAHVHAQGASVLPQHGAFAQVVGHISKAQELALLQGEVTEYLNDLLLSCFGHKWTSLPELVVISARDRLSEKDRAIIFN